MSKNKNFKINRNKSTLVKASSISIGDVFEREGSLHMRVHLCNPRDELNTITVCNLNTGSVWGIPEDSRVTIVDDCEITYTAKS